MKFTRVEGRRVLTVLGLLALVIVVAGPGAAAPGDLDPTFDGDGKVTTHFIFNDEAHGVAIQPDGKIVAAGFTVCNPCAGPTEPRDFALARYNRDGSLDSTFDGDGKVTTDFATNVDQAFAVAIQADGKIVAGGFAWVSGVDFALARYNTDGSLDPSFDGDGKVTTDYGFGSSQVYGLAIQADGKIVAAGYGAATAQDFFLARYTSNGSLDPSFDDDGKVTFLGFGPNHNQAHAVGIQPDGKIVAAGCANCLSSSSNFAVARLNTNGSRDPTFDGEGLVTTDFSGNVDQARALALQADGKVVVAGSAITGQPVFGLARYHTDGSLDSTFDGDGKLTTQFGNGDAAEGVAIQRDGKIVAAGGVCASCVAGGYFGLARYTPDGSLDSTFSGDGKVITDFGFAGDQKAYAVALQNDGKIVAAGVVGGDFALARYKVCRVTSRRSSIPCT
jgi:uncharacterized delta-60 repeat protein